MIRSVISDKVEIRSNSIDGRGLFAKETIFTNEIVFIKGGHILRRNELYSSSVVNSYLPISDEYYIGAISPEEEEMIKIFINHSCDPNCGLHGEISFVAIKEIAQGEELTIDYAFIDNEIYSFECHCGSPKCRIIITGFDWKIEAIQIAYYPYFAQYLKDKIDRFRNEYPEQPLLP